LLAAHLEERGLELETPWVRSLIQDPLAWRNSPAEIIAAWPSTEIRFALPASFDTQDAEAVLRVMECDALDESG
jgi:hypothetical protein